MNTWSWNYYELLRVNMTKSVIFFQNSFIPSPSPIPNLFFSHITQSQTVTHLDGLARHAQGWLSQDIYGKYISSDEIFI